MLFKPVLISILILSSICTGAGQIWRNEGLKLTTGLGALMLFLPSMDASLNCKDPFL
ncbi:hypothetical protein BaRGS_00027223, partial [Batillaria attramentaria]